MKRLVLFVALLLFASNLAALDFEEYVISLELIEQFLLANQLETAKEGARELVGQQVDSPRGRFHTDEALLLAIANTSRADHTLMLRLATTIDELRRSAPESMPPSDPKRLTAVAAEQSVPELAPGGDVPTNVSREIPFMEQIAEAIGEAWEWIKKKLVQLLEWILDLLPRRAPVAGAVGDIRWGVLAMTCIIVAGLIWLAFMVLRRSKGDTTPIAESTEPAGSKRDENPLSRGATEWERYAAQLANEGRYREAIRAWYHAVLVTCYASGILYFRKGRTNWEYVAMLGPSLPWRAEMIALTRRFEVEWYGHTESNEDAYDDCSARASRILESIRKGARDVA